MKQIMFYVKININFSAFTRMCFWEIPVRPVKNLVGNPK